MTALDDAIRQADEVLVLEVEALDLSEQLESSDMYSLECSETVRLERNSTARASAAPDLARVVKAVAEVLGNGIFDPNGVIRAAIERRLVKP